MRNYSTLDSLKVDFNRMNGTLFIVATPIGNLQDITLRALETLKTVDVILCEDTRVTAKLLGHFSIQKPLVSYHHHSDARKINEIKQLLADGKNIALVTDAGTPGISDPGNELISVIAKSDTRATKQSPEFTVGSTDKVGSDTKGIASPRTSARNNSVITPIPGPSAAIAALSVSGFSTDKFIFLGFPPHKNKRKQFFENVANSDYTTVYFESGHRIIKCLGELKALIPERRIVVCRELTKLHETIYRGLVEDVVEEMKEERGEFVVVVEGKR